MCAAQLDELPDTNPPASTGGSNGNLVPALIAIILAPALTVGMMYLVIEMNKPEESGAPQVGGQGPIDMEPSGEEKFYELNSLITNLGGPIKSRYINLELKLEGQAGDFEKILEMNEHRIRDKALSIMGGYTYEDAQLDGFQERVRVDLSKAFSSELRKYRDGGSDLIRQIYFTQFVVQ